MKEIRWDSEKDKELRWQRGMGFEEILQHTFLGFEEHPTRKAQRLMLFDVKGYVWAVPFVQSEKETFLKTAYPS